MSLAGKQIQISAALLEELLISIDGLSSVTDGTDAARVALARAGRATSAAQTLLRTAAGPGSFSGDEIGQYRIDPTQSPFI